MAGHSWLLLPAPLITTSRNRPGDAPSELANPELHRLLNV